MITFMCSLKIERSHLRASGEGKKREIREEVWGNQGEGERGEVLGQERQTKGEGGKGKYGYC